MAETTDDPLDLRGLKCPLPAMLARKALARLAAGVTLTVQADDPMALVDIPHMCHREGHALLNVTRHGAYADFSIRAAAISSGAAVAQEAEPDAHPHANPAAPHRDPDA